MDKELNELMKSEHLDLEDRMLTTLDNPHNPKTDYDLWRQWDVDNNYNTEEYLARVINLPVDTDVDDSRELDRLTQIAIYEILENDVLEIYKLV